MIRDIVVHFMNEQPVLVDAFEMPNPTDVGLVCTNIRTLDGKRPVFVEHVDSTFYFPYLNVRFIEILRGRDGAPAEEPPTEEAPVAAPPADDEELEIDEDFLRRIREA